VRKLAPPG